MTTLQTLMENSISFKLVCLLQILHSDLISRYQMITSISYRCTIHICVINSPCNFTYNLDCQILFYNLDCHTAYVRVLTICLLLVYFVSAAGCHCFDPLKFQCQILTCSYISEQYGNPSGVFPH